MESGKAEQIILWGDSLGKGVIWNAVRGRYGYARETAAGIAADKLHCRVINRSKFGCTAPMGLEIMKQDLSEQIFGDAALLEYGGNDCNFDWASISDTPDVMHAPNTMPEQFSNTLCVMVKMLRDASIRPILITLPPINPERYFRFFTGESLQKDNILRWLGDVWQIYRFQEMYSLLISDAARKLHVQLLDLRARCLAVPGFIREYLCEDGLHLNELGQAFAGEQIASLALSVK